MKLTNKLLRKGIKVFGTEEEFKKWLFKTNQITNILPLSLPNVYVYKLLNQIANGYPI